MVKTKCVGIDLLNEKSERIRPGSSDPGIPYFFLALPREPPPPFPLLLPPPSELFELEETALPDELELERGEEDRLGPE